MKLRLPFACMLLLLCFTISAQVSSPGAATLMGGPMFLADINGRAIPATQPDVEGTPLLSNDWSLGLC